MKSTKRKIWIIIAVIAVAAVLLCPFPQRVNKGYQGMAYPKDGGAGEPCTVELNGTIYHYLIRESCFKGVLWIRSEERTFLQDFYTIQMDRSTHMATLLPEVFSFGFQGFLITPDSFQTLYLQISDAGGTRWEITSPASNDAQAEKVREAAAMKLNGGGPLPEWAD